MASWKVEICLKKKTHPEHKYSVIIVSKAGTSTRLLISAQSLDWSDCHFKSMQSSLELGLEKKIYLVVALENLM